ncbi:hypothetical protein HZI59_10125, partial [Lactobacillus salivarius]|nr:hypothetical protein [Ligilactobacillus salivarius]
MKRQIANFSERIKACFLFPLALIQDLILMIVEETESRYLRKKYMGKRFDRWAKSQVFFGNPPLELFQKKIMQLSANDLLKLRLKLE